MKNKPLYERKCIACAGGTLSLTDAQGKALLEELGGGWEIVEGKKLTKNYKFHNFREALAFVNEIGALAEAEGHHPDIELSWGLVKIFLWTHKVGGLSESDFILAAKCDKIHSS